MSHDESHEILENGSGREIAVIGMSGRFPGARDLRELWRNLRDGVEGITFFSDEEMLAAGVPAERLSDPRYVKAASLLDGVDRFDAGFFGYSAREAEILDPQQRLFLEHAWAALEDAGYTPEGYEGLIGVYAGVAWNTYLLSNLRSHPELFDGGGGFQVFITNDKDFMPTRVSYKLNLRGPSVIVQTSCSTSLTAIHLACLSLLSYECDVALAGGVTVKVPQIEGYWALDGGLASPDGHCRPFDARAAGTIFGSGIGIVVLKRLSEALADGDTIHAVIKGSAINNDGSLKVSYTAPSVEGQAEVIAAAQAVAGVEPETVRYVECHGTGTSLGDPIEVTALTKVFREGTERKGFCALGSVKSNLGHLDAAAGVAGFLKTVLALEHREIPPSLNFERPNPAIDFDSSPFYVNTALAPWEADGGPRRAGVSSFGVGGTNAHVILEEAPPAEAPSPSRPWQLLTLSARSPEALEEATHNLAAWLRDADPAALPDAAYTLKVGRSVFRHRRVVVCKDRDAAVAALESRDPVWMFSAADLEDPRERPVVFLFPGQGAQHVNMGRGLYEREEVFRAEIDHCAERLRPLLNLDLRRVLYPVAGEEEEAARELGRTGLTQPALFVVEYALARLWMSWGVRPQALMGHSIGEYVAACLAGVMSLEDALRLVAARGRLMESLPAGVMLGVPLAEEELAPLLPEGVSIAAINEPARSVASGPEEGIAALERALDEKGVSHRRLHTSHAFHSAMMDPVLDRFTAEVSRVALRNPEIPFISNVTGTWITPEQATDPDYWARHLRQPVRFADGTAELLRDPRRVLLEVGPGRTLATLAGRHPERTEQAVVASLGHPQDRLPDEAAVLTALGRLWLAGLRLDWSGFHAGERRRRVPLPTYPFERQRYWIDAAAEAPSTPAPAVEIGKRPDVADWFYLPSWKPALPAAAAMDPRRWLVLAGPDGPSAELAARLAGHGEVITVEPGELRPELWDALIADLRAQDRLPDAIVHAWSLDEEPLAGDAAAFEAVQERGFYSLLGLARAMAKQGWTPRELIVVASGLCAVSPQEELRPERTTMLGLLKVLPQEVPGLACRAVDAIPGGRTLDTVVAELAAESSEFLVACRGGRRWLQSFEPVHLDTASPLRPGGVYLLTGGLENNGLGFARYLAREARARLVLVQPPSAPPDEAIVRSLRELGAEVLVVTADLADTSAMSAMSAAVALAESRFGALHGVIHTAGTVGERTFRLVRELDREACSWHFQPKAHALFALEKALAGRELDFCVLLSSLATVLGGVAYSAYTAANLFLEAFVQEHNRRGGQPWVSLGWDVWELEGGQEQITAVRDDLAGLAMGPREGEEAFRRAAGARGVDSLLVSTVDLSERASQAGRRIGALQERAEVAAGGRHPRPSLATPYAAPESDLERRIAEVWKRTLGFEQIGVHDNFFELGGDSFVAVQVVSRLQSELGIELPVARLYQGLTVRSLAALLAQDEAAAGEQRAALLEERRESMGRRRELFERRRSSRKSEAVEP
ncbi:MAG TPA: SDR family NAD(P)-dependent oxidoreductase [Thermoanaerobaculia bacterium]|jgi:acyl transferase domain-containing protein/acyl carrier protein|nr:SDR family NAD(P)-dependent oxidoreductase [Thermoanaerobaculia bacterium]